MQSLSHYLSNSGVTVLRAYTFYRPLRVFLMLGMIFLAGGLVLGGRFLYFFANGQGFGHVQSLILTSVLLIVGFQILLIGLLADLVAAEPQDRGGVALPRAPAGGPAAPGAPYRCA